MTGFWDQFVDVLRESMIAYAYLFNGNFGAGILAVTFLARLALSPLTIRLARLTSAHQAIMAKIQPELDDLKRLHANNAQRMREEIQKVDREGISPVPLASCVGIFAQTPIMIAIYSSVRQVAMLGGRFAWVRDISRPDAILTVIVAIIGSAGMLPSPGQTAQNRYLMMTLSTVVTIVVLSKLSAGVALYWGMSNAFGVAQNYVTNRRVTRTADVD